MRRLQRLKPRGSLGKEVCYHPLMSEAWEANVEFHRLYEEARRQRNSYFEKLAVLDGGTVALVITAVLGPLHGTIKHRYTLGAGLTFLVVAMLTLLRRNFLAAQLEFHALAGTSNNAQYLANRTQTVNLERDIHYTELTGVILSAIGVLLLLTEVWLLLVQG